MSFIKKIQGGIYHGIGIILVIGVTGVAYGAYVAMTDVTTGQSLTAATFNQVQENIRVLKTTVDGHTTTLSGLSNVPAGAVMAFNLTTCPSGWYTANGGNGTPDLRGEFVRGWDNGRGVDSGRGIGTLQRGSLVMNTVGFGDARVFSLTHDSDLGYDPALTNSSQYYGRRDTVANGGGNLGTWGGLGFVDTNYVKMTRPRNVALLYCVKQ